MRCRTGRKVFAGGLALKDFQAQTLDGASRDAEEGGGLACTGTSVGKGEGAAYVLGFANRAELEESLPHVGMRHTTPSFEMISTLPAAFNDRMIWLKSWLLGTTRNASAKMVWKDCPAWDLIMR